MYLWYSQARIQTPSLVFESYTSENTKSLYIYKMLCMAYTRFPKDTHTSRKNQGEGLGGGGGAPNSL